MRRIVRWLVALALLTAATGSGAWYWATGRLEQGFSDWVALRRTEGWVVAFAPPSRAGWPARAELIVPDFVLGRPGGAGGAGAIGWRSPLLTLRVRPRDPGHLVIAPSGTQLVGPMAPDAGGAADPAAMLAISADRLEWTVPLDATGPGLTAAILARRLRIGRPGGGGAPDADTTVAVAALSGQLVIDPTAGAGQAVLGMHLRATTIAWPAGPREAASPSQPIALMEAEATIDGPAVVAPGPARARAAAWRDGGGAARLRLLALEFGDLRATGTARLGLDAALQPAGEARLAVSGQDAALTELAAERLITPGAARAAGAVLGLLARTPPEGGPPVVEIPLTLRDGVLEMGAIPLARPRPMAW